MAVRETLSDELFARIIEHDSNSDLAISHIHFFTASST